MNKGILITRPNYDPVTKYLCWWSKELVGMAQAKGLDVYDLEGPKANRKTFESYIGKKKPSFLFINGHGNSKVITGDNHEPLLDAASKIVASVIYARSCEAAATLGAQLVNGHTKAFIGYKRKFFLVRSLQHINQPLKDPLARLFLEPSNLVVSTLLKDHSARDADIRSKSAMYRNFRRMLSSQASYEERAAARWLWANLNNQVLLGKPDATI